MNTRPQSVERANLLIALRACDLDAYCARNFRASAHAPSRAGDDALVIVDFF